MEEVREKLKESIIDVGNWLIRKPYKDENPIKILELLGDSLYSKTVINAIEKDISHSLKVERNMENEI